MQVNSNIIKDNFLSLFSKYMYMLPIIKKKLPIDSTCTNNIILIRNFENKPQSKIVSNWKCTVNFTY